MCEAEIYYNCWNGVAPSLNDMEGQRPATTRDCKPVGILKGTAGILIILFQVRAQVRRKQANYIAGQQFLANNCAPPKGKRPLLVRGLSSF